MNNIYNKWQCTIYSPCLTTIDTCLVSHGLCSGIDSMLNAIECPSIRNAYCTLMHKPLSVVWPYNPHTFLRQCYTTATTITIATTDIIISICPHCIIMFGLMITICITDINIAFIG